MPLLKGYAPKGGGQGPSKLKRRHGWLQTSRTAGDRAANPFRAAKGNTDETKIGQTSAVGIFPNGTSPYGVLDMSGNIWECCWSNYDEPMIEARKENLRTKKNRVLRSGTWFNIQVDAGTVHRDYGFPAASNNGIGFRVVRVVRPPS